MTSSISVHDGGRVSAVENGEIQSKSCDADDTTPQSWADIVRSKFLGSDPRSCAGVCMLAFAVPLLIPGITLTVVVFEDEKGFSKFSALHIIGMILLTVSILLTIAGLVLSIHCRSKVNISFQGKY
ncbi:hypothetical protein Btru_070866 [Bulinus truncatus]|nr:hypothetical protein Btru_070866 [Bulinus truncatus]